jgi:hypothetical protein
MMLKLRFNLVADAGKIFQNGNTIPFILNPNLQILPRL